MNHLQIKALIDRYFEGETTLEEEQLIKQYFKTQAPETEELVRLAPLFMYLDKEKAIEMPGKPAVPLHSSEGAGKKRFLYPAAAAIALFLMCGSWFIWQNMEKERIRTAARERLYRDHYDNPEQALAEVKSALALVGKKMNKGRKITGKGLKEVKRLEIFK